MSGKSKVVMIVMESLSGSGYKTVSFRPRQASTKKEMIGFDPVVQQNVLFRESKKLHGIRPFDNFPTKKG